MFYYMITAAQIDLVKNSIRKIKKLRESIIMNQSELLFAKTASLQAGELLRKQKLTEVDSAEGKDIKLALDKISEATIVDCLSASGIPVLTEESGFQNGSEKSLREGKLWIIDPLDGTANYWKGMRELSCVSIALWEDGKPVLGVINRFFCDELFVGVVGEGAWLNDKPIVTSMTEQISQSVLATGFPLKRSYEYKDLERSIKQIQNFKKIRMLGAAAIMGAFVACGRVDAYMEEDIMLWDIAASGALVVAAGGTVEIKEQKDYKCICRMFANENLKGNYYADCI